MNTTIKNTAAYFTSENPVLKYGQLAFETDTNRFKLGDGLTAWNDLLYLSEHAVIDCGDANDSINPQLLVDEGSSGSTYNPVTEINQGASFLKMV